MSYLNILQSNNIQQKNSNSSECITGTCYTMCPEEEIKMRERETLVHVLEVWGPVKKYVKSYSRSAADTKMAVPKLLRPYSVLMDTTRHLLLEVTKRTDVPTCVVYDFVNDRLRAVRQDMTIQRVPPEHCASLLEPMIRFYVYFGYRLCELSLKDYDPVLNRKYLLECLKWCLTCFDSIDNDGNRINELASVLSNVNIDNKRKLQCDRVLVESLYLLCNLNDVHPLVRCINLPKKLISASMLQLAYQISLANYKKNYVLVSKLMESLCPLAYCAVFAHLPELQRRALLVMSHAYNSKQLTVPCDVVRRWLHLPGICDVTTTCQHYGLTVQGGAIRFDKGQFKTDAGLHNYTKTYTNERLNMNSDHIFTYKS